MHSINVTKPNDAVLRTILQSQNVPFTVYDIPTAYSIISIDAMIPLTLVEKIKQICVESATTFDSTQVKGKEYSLVENERVYNCHTAFPTDKERNAWIEKHTAFLSDYLRDPSQGTWVIGGDPDCKPCWLPDYRLIETRERRSTPMIPKAIQEQVKDLMNELIPYDFARPRPANYDQKIESVSMTLSEMGFNMVYDNGYRLAEQKKYYADDYGNGNVYLHAFPTEKEKKEWIKTCPSFLSEYQRNEWKGKWVVCSQQPCWLPDYRLIEVSPQEDKK